jgi:hypothetical protein
LFIGFSACFHFSRQTSTARNTLLLRATKHTHSHTPRNPKQSWPRARETRDRVPGPLDSLIEKKQKQIELLKEQRTAIINQAVTKGLNPDAKMKDSRIEWLGEIPLGIRVRSHDSRISD